MDFTEFVNKFQGVRFTPRQKNVLIDILLDDSVTEVFEHYFERESKNTDPKSYGKEITLGKNEEWRNWANSQKFLDGSNDEVKLVSWYVHTIGGFAPNFYTKKMWLKSIEDLLSAGGGDPKVVEEGVKAGQKARTESDLTFSNPLSYKSFVLDISSKAQLKQSGFKFKEEIWA